MMIIMDIYSWALEVKVWEWCVWNTSILQRPASLVQGKCWRCLWRWCRSFWWMIQNEPTITVMLLGWMWCTAYNVVSEHSLDSFVVGGIVLSFGVSCRFHWSLVSQLKEWSYWWDPEGNCKTPSTSSRVFSCLWWWRIIRSTNSLIRGGDSSSWRVV